MKGSKFFLALIVSLFCFTVTASVADFDIDKTRQILIELATDTSQTVEIFNPAPQPGSPQEAFINFYIQKIQPVDTELTAVVRSWLSYNELIDAGLYKTETERSLWQAELDKADAVYNKYSSDPEWENNQREWGKLAENLSGDLAESARRRSRLLEFSHYPADAQPLLKEQTDLSTEIDKIANTSPLKEKMQENQVKDAELTRDFFDGKIPFSEAAKKLEALNQEGYYAYGADVAIRGADKINRYAQILNLLAQKKGYKNHAEFALAAQAISHDPRFQGKTNLLKFLYGLLDSTDAAVRAYYQVRAKQVANKPLSELRPEEQGILGFPTYLLLRDYFPKERLVDIWHNTMLQSGFSEDVLGNIIVDAFPRPNKNNHAYMRPLRTPSPRTLSVNGESLAMSPGTEWLPARIYILQNFIQDGLGDLETAFHEGGHGLDYSYQRDHIGFSSAYGYTETHSMTMEHFITDKEFLLANGKMRDGTSLSRELIDLFIKRKTVSDILRFRGLVKDAIFDIELWDYDYANGREKLVERALKIAARLDERVNFIKFPTDLKFGPGYANFVTEHFRSGEVRYYGYVLAEVSAALMAGSLYEKLRGTTGRASLYNQPTLASLLGEGIYAHGMFKSFPLQIEEFTGKEFSPENFAAELVNRLMEFVSELEKQGKSKP